jgi:hypothetical protein
MTARRLGAGLLGLAVLLAAETAAANWLTAIPNSIARDFKRRNCWPRPFNCPDRYAARAPFAVMVANGWMRQNSLGEHHFESGGAELTEAGKLKVQWIVFQAPSRHRTIYVHRSLDPHVTAERLATVDRYSQALVIDGTSPPPVLASDDPPAGWPAQRVDAIGRKFQASMPDPRLPCAKEGGD